MRARLDTRLAWLQLLCFFSFDIQQTYAVFDPANPGNAEAFNRADADPRGAITCVGGPPADSTILRLPRTPNDFADLTAQQICAKPQYGGRGPNQHAGAYCYSYGDRRDRPDGPLYKTVTFDDSPRAKALNVLRTARILTWCKLRCFCAALATREEAEAQIMATIQPREYYRLTLDGPPELDFGPPPNALSNQLSYNISTYDQKIAQKQRAVRFNDDADIFRDYKEPMRPPVRAVVLNPINRIECAGNFPLAVEMTFFDPRGPPNLPTRRQATDFTAQQICANALSGGHR